ncbi:M23 family metallopeptidase [Rhizobium laguerreae]|uniref:M23 family metallopeptidase n=1 Tax=Rhizobium laguerreae TaxID=1076926 RepID=UPI001C924710|nr:M23 family metallopeptidase [Rhizobium laguerreae]MBY3500869.1 M23 family metallopeptidase [Rhizobium laguerreae]MBY3573021.1 M23 family metallopeptidase [Rhizobium laguerreae]
MKMGINQLAFATISILLSTWSAVLGQDLSYVAPGDILPRTNLGIADRVVSFPAWRFPMNVGSAASQHAYIGTQLSKYHGVDWANDPRLFAYPSRDNQCEPREWKVNACPSGIGHQGVDIRANSNADNTWEVTAVEDGVVTSVTNNTTVRVRSGNHTVRYLHMHPQSIILAGIKEGVLVRQGQVLGKVSCFMSGSCTTSRHLHLDAYSGTEVRGNFYHVYPSLIAAYRRAWRLDAGIVDGELARDPAREVGGGTVPTPGSGNSDPCAASTGNILPGSDISRFDSLWMHNCSTVGLIVGPGNQRSFVYQRPRTGIQDVVATDPILFNGTLDQGELRGQATQYSSRCGNQHFAVTGRQEQSGDSRTIILSGNRQRRDINCAVTGNVAEKLVFTFASKATIVDVPEPHVIPGDRKTLSEITRNFLAITFYPRTDGKITILPYFQAFPGRLAEGGQFDSKGGLIPALSTDEGGVALSWTWVNRRALYASEGNLTPRLVAHSMAGVDPGRCDGQLNAAGSPVVATDAAAAQSGAASTSEEANGAQSECDRVNAYLRGYIGYSGGRNFAVEYFGRQIPIDEKLDMSDGVVRWNWMRTMYSHESGRPPVIDRAAFDRGIAFGEDYIASFYDGNTQRLRPTAFYSDPCNFRQPACTRGGPATDAGPSQQLSDIARDIGEVASTLSSIGVRLQHIGTGTTGTAAQGRAD